MTDIEKARTKMYIQQLKDGIQSLIDCGYADAKSKDIQERQRMQYGRKIVELEMSMEE